MTLTMCDALPVPITKLAGLMSRWTSEFVWMNSMREIYPNERIRHVDAQSDNQEVDIPIDLLAIGRFSKKNDDYIS